MAVCEIWSVRGRLDHPIDYAKNPDKTANPNYLDSDLQALGDVMQYATNGRKTEQQFFVTGVNCDPATARQEMQAVKRQFGDKKEIVCYHGYQSFRQGEVTPEQAHEIGIKLAQSMWGDRFQVIVATHLNTECLHNHFVVNAVSFADGKRYLGNLSNIHLMRQKSDELCRQYQLSIIEHPDGRKKPYAMVQAEKSGIPTRNDIARQAIDEAISKSFTLRDFDRNIAAMGFRCSFNPNHKYWTIIGKGWKRPKRMHKLGEDYTNDRIMERIAENSYAVRFSDFAPERTVFKIYHIRGSLKKVHRHKGLRGLYLYYCYRLGFLPKKRKINYTRLHSLLRDDLMKMDAIAKETRLLCQYRIDTAEQLFSYQDSIRTEAMRLTEQRVQLRKQLRKLPDGDEKETARQEIAEISERLRTIRREVRLCDNIAERSGMIREELKQIQQEEQQRKEQTKHADRRRSSRSGCEDEFRGG
ncbi:MAG: relaxase/mobilization nuclease domain-containing protein [Clostridia bacterium]|nr:relaxase/mobilization nuclease domain-containing protein [Clostridia bacterium]